MLVSLGFCLRQHRQLLMLVFLLKIFFLRMNELIKTKEFEVSEDH